LARRDQKGKKPKQVDLHQHFLAFGSTFRTPKSRLYEL
jgi:predicted LPLAT superfamily acyltransferase